MQDVTQAESTTNQLAASKYIKGISCVLRLPGLPVLWASTEQNHNAKVLRNQVIPTSLY